MTDSLIEILRDSNYNLTIFSGEEVAEFKKRINFKLDRDKKKPS